MNLNFDEWLEAVNEELLGLSGFSSEDLPDCAYWDAWVSCEEPYETAVKVLENA